CVPDVPSRPLGPPSSQSTGAAGLGGGDAAVDVARVDAAPVDATRGDATPRDAARVEATPDVFQEACGNGRLDAGEQCDDGNHAPGDGCNPICQIECSWICGTCGPAPSCMGTLVCGNGVRTRDEGCDDGNLAAGDGCSPTCQVEPGWQCPVPGFA